jgi:hypothetical protein
MLLKFDWFDGRSFNHRVITDQHTGKRVGVIRSDGAGGGGGIEVDLFDGKYRIIVDNYKACWGFVKGVEAVLNHMVSVKDQSDSKAA